jgi:hypothetical protein
MPAKAEAQTTRVNARATRVRDVKRGIERPPSSKNFC